MQMKSENKEHPPVHLGNAHSRLEELVGKAFANRDLAERVASNLIGYIPESVTMEDIDSAKQRSFGHGLFALLGMLDECIIRQEKALEAVRDSLAFDERDLPF